MTNEERFDRIDANIAELKESVARLEATVAATATNLDRLTQFVLDFRGETVHQLEIMDNRLNMMTASLNNIEARFSPITKAILDFGKEATHLNVELSRHRSRMDGLETQISKLNPAA